jgi:hypothetical protein
MKGNEMRMDSYTTDKNGVIVNERLSHMTEQEIDTEIQRNKQAARKAETAWNERFNEDLLIAVKVLKLQRELYALKWWQFRARRKLFRELVRATGLFT